MPTPLNPRKNENPSTYFVQNRGDEKEFTRLNLQERMLTAGMGGVLSEQANPTVFRRVLDVGCGAAGWLIEAAQTYPEMSLVGIDISQGMIEYARTQAEAHHVYDQIKFHVMDALGLLEFPAAFFDLVNLRLGISFVRIWDWPKMLSKLLQVTRPDGVVRVTDTEAIPPSNRTSTTSQSVWVPAGADESLCSRVSSRNSRRRGFLRRYEAFVSNGSPIHPEMGLCR